MTVDGAAMAPGTDFDDTTTQAFARSIEDEPGPDREIRRLLYWTMRRAGFVVFAGEWWHFEYGTRRWSGITGQPPIYGLARPVLPTDLRSRSD
jgi:D-alanyl-D-alanine dipeptidase